MCAKQYENPTMLSRVTAKNVGDVFFETHVYLKTKNYARPISTETTPYLSAFQA